jgi:aspartate carbamoyltransferase
MLTDFAFPDEEMLASFVGKDILGAPQFSKAELEAVLGVAAFYEKALAEGKRLWDMDGKVMAALFFEPSTRTRLSFETAMHRLGGRVITLAESPENQISSTSKGETVHDTIKMVNNYADVIVIRSPRTGDAQIAAAAASHPVINAGDGFGQHPSQALLDMYTIVKEKGSPEGLSVAMIGDLKYGRTVHSLVDFLKYYKCRLILASPEQLKMPEDIVQKMLDSGIEVDFREGINEAVKDADIIYMTRVQKERFADLAEYEAVKDMYLMTGETVQHFKPGAVIMHALPRVNEIALEVDDYPGAAYFRQAGNGLFVRMALLAMTAGQVKGAFKPAWALEVQ